MFTLWYKIFTCDYFAVKNLSLFLLSVSSEKSIEKLLTNYFPITFTTTIKYNLKKLTVVYDLNFCRSFLIFSDGTIYHLLYHYYI